MPLIKPQPGPQETFLAAPADIAVYGGAAGGGKTWALVCEPLRHIHRPNFRAVIFRRNAVQVRNPGGLWDESVKLYSASGGQAREPQLEWSFPTGARIKFAHLEHDQTVLAWQGSQLPFIAFDELTHFTENQFFYLLSRNRGLCGIRPYIRATTNPDADSWVAAFINWWIDPQTGLAIPERSGRLRWMIRVNNQLVWADRPEELTADHGADCGPKSVTFISSSLFDNQILMDADPGYLANLKALPLVDRERLLGGNWKVRPAAGLYFQRSWCPRAAEAPAGLKLVRYWDLAATEKTENNDPDFTVGIKMGLDESGRYYILDLQSFRKSPHGTKRAVLEAAEDDGPGVEVGLPRDPGQAGKAQAWEFTRSLAGRRVKIRAESGSKLTRFSAFSAQAEAGNVIIVRAPWNRELFEALESFPESRHDDHADAASGAFNLLTEQRKRATVTSRYASGL